MTYKPSKLISTIITGLAILFYCSSCSSIKKQPSISPIIPFIGNWALVLPNGDPAWLSLNLKEQQLNGEIWSVGLPNHISELKVIGETFYFKRKIKIGAPNYPGGKPTGEKVLVSNQARVDGDIIQLLMEMPKSDGTIESLSYTGKRLPPLPPKPDLSKIAFGEPIKLFNGKNLSGWRLTNAHQENRWKALNGELVNETPKVNFDPYARYGNLRTDKEFLNFNLQLEFKVPKGGNSGVYLCGRYEAQVVDRDSRMQGIQGVGAIFGRIKPSENAGKQGGEWQKYDITLVDRHVTVILNGKKIIDNEPILGSTKGSLDADETKPGPIYLQGDHTSVNYRNIILTPVLEGKIGSGRQNEFKFWDANEDGKLEVDEILTVNEDAFDHVDRDVDWLLSEKEYKAYNKYLKKIVTDRALIPQDIESYIDIAYVENGHKRQKLDLYLPKNADSNRALPLVIWVHGGGWQRGTKQQAGRVSFLLKHGFAVASINYRLSRHAPFPAQIYDCKAAVRFLRKNALHYGLDPDKFGIWGASAGGQLVTLLGTSGGVLELEGNIGVMGVSSEVQAVCDWYGPTDLHRHMGNRNGQEVKDISSVVKPIAKFLGGSLDNMLTLSKTASAVNYITKEDPPFLIMHGDQDAVVPMEQSTSFQELLQQSGLDSKLVIVQGAKHVFFTTPSELQKVTDFFKKKLNAN